MLSLQFTFMEPLYARKFPVKCVSVYSRHGLNLKIEKEQGLYQAELCSLVPMTRVRAGTLYLRDYQFFKLYISSSYKPVRKVIDTSSTKTSSLNVMLSVCVSNVCSVLYSTVCLCNETLNFVVSLAPRCSAS